MIEISPNDNSDSIKEISSSDKYDNIIEICPSVNSDSIIQIIQSDNSKNSIIEIGANDNSYSMTEIGPEQIRMTLRFNHQSYLPECIRYLAIRSKPHICPRKQNKISRTCCGG